MGEIPYLATKFGAKALPLLISEHGLFAGLFAFFAFMHIGHFTIGVLLVIVGVFVPQVPDPTGKHDVKVGQGHTSLSVSGSLRTVLCAVGALVIIGSLFETVE